MIEREREMNQSNRFIVDILDYTSPSLRIQGFQTIRQIGLQGPKPMLILTHSAFEAYRNSGIIPELKETIGQAFDQIRSQNPERGAYVGRAFFVPEIKNPNGPRTAAIRNKKEYLTEVERFWLFAIQHQYDQKGADIALILHPFLHAMDPPRTHYGEIRLGENERLPHSGGYALCSPVPGIPKRVEIRALFGTDEAVQGHPQDVFLVDPESQTILEKRIVYKDETFVPKTGSQYETFKVPRKFRLRQALTDFEVLQLAQQMKKVEGIRTEFLVQKDGVFFREIAPHDPAEEYQLCKIGPNEKISGSVVRVSNSGDIAKIKGHQPIIYMGPETYYGRTGLFLQVAQSQKETINVMAHGWHQTAHQARLLHDYGHNIIHVGEKSFNDGDRVEISLGTSGLPEVKMVNPYSQAIISLDNVQNLVNGQAGRKMARLAIMKEAGVHIPQGFAVNSEAVWEHLKYTNLLPFIQQLEIQSLKNKEQLERPSKKIQEKIQTSSLHFDFKTQLEKTIASSQIKSFAVRSSGEEDSRGGSLAGLFKSYLDVPPSQVEEKLLRTLASYFTPEAIMAFSSIGKPITDLSLGIGVHEFVGPDSDGPPGLGGTVFTYPDKIVVEAVKGLPVPIVTGTAQNFCRITIDRKSNLKKVKKFGNEQLCPNFETDSRQVLTHLVILAHQIEEIFESYQDIEWICNQKYGLVILQARPM